MNAEYNFKHLLHAAHIGDMPYHADVHEWNEKLTTIELQLADVPLLLAAHKARHKQPHPLNPRMTLIDSTPTIRLANGCEALVNGLYSTAEIAADFGNKISKGIIPTSFNALRKKCEKGDLPEIASSLGDLQWYRKVREIKTEWAHFSSIFVGAIGDETILCFRSNRRASDRQEFKEKKFCTIAELQAWVRGALTTLDRFASFVLTVYVLPSLDAKSKLPWLERDELGFPKQCPDERLISE